MESSFPHREWLVKDNIAFGLPLLPGTIRGVCSFPVWLVCSDRPSTRAAWLGQQTQGPLCSDFCSDPGILSRVLFFLSTLRTRLHPPQNRIQCNHKSPSKWKRQVRRSE